MNSQEPAGFILPLLKTPHIITRALSMVFYKHFGVRKDYRRADGITTVPLQQVSIKITNACNLRCKTCGQWGETGYNHDKDKTQLNRTVSLERYLKLVHEVKESRPVYYIWGGEPFLYPGLMELTAEIKKQKSLLALVTNATLCRGKEKEIVDQKWDALMFSLDGSREIHDTIRGKEGTYDRMASSVAEIRKYRKEKKSSLPWLMALVTVSVDNAGSLDQIFEAAETMGVDCVIVYYSWFTDEKTGQAHTGVFEKYLNVTPESWKGYLFNHSVDTHKLKESIRRIRSRKWKFQHLFIPDLKEFELDRYYQEPSDFFGYGPCISPWLTAEIMPNGDVTTCRDYPDYILGNIEENRLEEIWNNEKSMLFRKSLLKAGGTFPICSRCCGLMGW